jgi:hypothetical protein
MSRVLSQLLGADEAALALRLRTLERAAGNPRADIRLVSDVATATRQKLQALGLDPADTTGHELYNSLQLKLYKDEVELRKQLGVESAPQQAVIEAVQRKLSEQKKHSKVFVLKQTALKRVLKQLKPKATMKALGYRSMESMLKHEPAAQLLAATLIAESTEWHTKRLEAYKTLQPTDFELRHIQCIAPSTKKWPALCERYATEIRQHVVTLPEAGTVVLLPHSHELKVVATVTFILALEGMNTIRSLSSYLKLHQVEPNFGHVVAASLVADPTVETGLASGDTPWKVAHWFYARHDNALLPEAFEPHLQPEDFTWHSVGKTLAGLHDSFAFWEGTQALGHVDGKDVVSLNILDVAISMSNGFHYAERVVTNFQDQLAREFTGRYLHPDSLRQVLNETLSKRLTLVSDDELELV